MDSGFPKGIMCYTYSRVRAMEILGHIAVCAHSPALCIGHKLGTTVYFEKMAQRTEMIYLMEHLLLSQTPFTPHIPALFL